MVGWPCSTHQAGTVNSSWRVCPFHRLTKAAQRPCSPRGQYRRCRSRRPFNIPLRSCHRFLFHLPFSLVGIRKNNCARSPSSIRGTPHKSQRFLSSKSQISLVSSKAGMKQIPLHPWGLFFFFFSLFNSLAHKVRNFAPLYMLGSCKIAKPKGPTDEVAICFTPALLLGQRSNAYDLRFCQEFATMGVGAGASIFLQDHSLYTTTLDRRGRDGEHVWDPIMRVCFNGACTQEQIFDQYTGTKPALYKRYIDDATRVPSS